VLKIRKDVPLPAPEPLSDEAVDEMFIKIRVQQGLPMTAEQLEKWRLMCLRSGAKPVEFDSTPTGFAPDLDAAVRERQGAPVPKVRIVVPNGRLATGHSSRSTQTYCKGWNAAMEACIAAIRAAGATPVNAKGEEL
jgi:hypothetical protein